MSYYKRNLPHWQPGEGNYFVTYRLAGSLPVEVVEKFNHYRKNYLDGPGNISDEEKLDLERKLFHKFDQLLARSSNGPHWLQKPKIADKVIESIEFFEPKYYHTYAYCVMPNHVHWVLRLLKIKEDVKYPLTDILQRIKSYSASEANKILGRSGKFWNSESFDRVIRDERELENTIRYTLNNPVKGGFVDNWENWPYSYCDPYIVDSFY